MRGRNNQKILCNVNHCKCNFRREIQLSRKLHIRKIRLNLQCLRVLVRSSLGISYYVNILCVVTLAFKVVLQWKEALGIFQFQCSILALFLLPPLLPFHLLSLVLLPPRHLLLFQPFLRGFET